MDSVRYPSPKRRDGDEGWATQNPEPRTQNPEPDPRAERIALLEPWIVAIVRRARAPFDQIPDIVQEVMVRLIARIDLVENAGDPDAYVAQTTRNVLTSIRRAARRQAKRELIVDLSDCMHLGAGVATNEILGHSIAEAAANLGPRVQDVVSAWRHCGSAKGAARMLGLDVRQVKRCFAKLAKALRGSAVTGPDRARCFALVVSPSGVNPGEARRAVRAHYPEKS